MRQTPSERARLHTRPFSAPVSASQVRVGIIGDHHDGHHNDDTVISYCQLVNQYKQLMMANKGGGGMVPLGSLLQGASSGAHLTT